ncbi:MAG: twin-arginine translocase subunit TatC [Candidatus Omnitrophica bacterium]|nr:twin-arginine translocase subunit TatC [Candidatus Omnitrophota bacterium]
MVKKLTFIEHLEELRLRIIKSIVFIILVSGIMYSLKDKIFSYLVKPLGGTLVFIAPAEAIIATIKIALFGGLFLSSPYILYHIWDFISEGLGWEEKKHASLFGLLSFIFFIAGISFGYFVIVPIAIKFLLGFSTDFVIPMISVGRYVSFVGIMTLVFGVVFQLPIAILFLSKIGVVTPRYLSRNRKYAIVIMFIAGAIFTPPDVITQCLLAVPLLLLYELSIILSRLINRKR